MNDNKEMRNELQKDTPTSSDNIEEHTIPRPTPVLQRCELEEMKCEDPDFNTFLFFPFLPAELRLKIWRMCALLPRVVHINYDVNSVIGEQRRYPGSHPRCKWRICNPVAGLPVLEACKEAHYECGREHRRVGYRLDVLVLQQWKLQRTLVNWERDIIFLNTNACNAVHDAVVGGPDAFPLRRRAASKIKHLAISRRLWIQWPFLQDSAATREYYPSPRKWGDECEFQNMVIRACTSAQDCKIVFDSERAKERQDEPAFGMVLKSPERSRLMLQSLMYRLQLCREDWEAQLGLVRRLSSKPKKKQEGI